MKNVLLTASVALLIVLSCKKETSDPEPDQPATSTSTTGGGTTGTVPTGSATSYNGILTIGNSTISMAGLSISSKAATAFFSAAPVSVANSAGVSVDKVYVNGDSLVYGGNGNYSGIVPSVAALVWSVSGANGIPSFSYTNNNPFPSSPNLDQLPTEISKSAGFQLSIGNVQNSHSGTFILNDGSGNLQGIIVMPVKAGNNNISFTGAQLNGLSTGTTALVMISLENGTAVNLNGKDFSFRKSVQVIKQIAIKP